MLEVTHKEGFLCNACAVTSHCFVLFFSLINSIIIKFNHKLLTLNIFYLNDNQIFLCFRLKKENLQQIDYFLKIFIEIIVVQRLINLRIFPLRVFENMKASNMRLASSHKFKLAGITHSAILQSYSLL